MYLITVKNIAADLAKEEGGIDRETLVSYRYIRSYWKQSHRTRVDRLLKNMKQRGHVAICEGEDKIFRYQLTDAGRTRFGLPKRQ